MPHVGKLKKSTFLQPYLEELQIIMIRIVSIVIVRVLSQTIVF